MSSISNLCSVCVGGHHFESISFIDSLLYYFFINLEGARFSVLSGIGITTNWCTNPDTPDDDESGGDDDNNKVDWVIAFWLSSDFSDWYGSFE